MIPEHLIEQIAQANDIIDVVSGYFPLKRAGSTYKACCPFHHEKTPSFTVNPARQIFKCFGCGAGGGVFKFVELYENLSFPEAVKRLASRVGIRVEEEPLTAEESAKQKLKHRLLAIHAGAAQWFHTNLMRTKAAQGARNYLKKRGFTVDVAKSWKLGYAPDSWDALTQWAYSEGFSDEELVSSGLVTWKSDEEGRRIGNVYDRFRDRLMFPICDKDTSEVIAFSGRVLNPEAFGGKYVNSPETPIFIKGKVLFGLQKTKRALIDKKAAIVCEGQIDLITAYEAGVQNVTASQGTAFTPHQAQTLKRYVDEVILCFDSDAAGLKAAERSLPHLLDAGLSVRVAEMPAGHDPDSLIRTEGADAFAQQIAKARDFFEFQIERAVATPDFDTPKGKAAFAHKMAESVALVSDPLLREAVIHNVSTRLGMQPARFIALLKAPQRHAPRTDDRDEPKPVNAEPTLAPLSNTTRILCQLVLASPEVRSWLLAQPWEPLFQALPEAELLTIIMKGQFDPANPASIAAFLTTCDAEVQAALADLLDVKNLPAEPLRQAQDCWRDLKRRELEYQRDAAAARARQPELSFDEMMRFQIKAHELQQQINAMRA